MHAVKKDATKLLFIAVMARHILQMHGTNCRNDNQFLETENEKDKKIENQKNKKSFTSLDERYVD